MDSRGAERSSHVFRHIIRNDGVTGSNAVCGTRYLKQLVPIGKYGRRRRYVIGTQWPDGTVVSRASAAKLHREQHAHLVVPNAE